MIPIAKPLIGDEEKKAVMEVMDSGVIAQGPRVSAFEEAFKDHAGSEYAVAVSSGTTGLHLALLASGIKPGDEVITTSFSFIATGNSILYCGARPVFADIDERTFNLDPLDVAGKVTDKTKAILCVHLYGQTCDMGALQDICDDKGLLLIEDACQAHGAEHHGLRAGVLGDCAVFSFYPTKNMATGEGGMITTNDDEIADRSRLLREHGMRIRYHHEFLGYNYRMTDIEAAIGIEQLKKLDGFNTSRIKNAEKLTRGINDIDGLTPPYTAPHSKHVFHQYTIKVEPSFKLSRDEVVRELNENGIGTGIYYPLPIHQQSFYGDLKSELPVTEKLSKEVLSLPVHPALTADEVDYITRTLSEL